MSGEEEPLVNWQIWVMGALGMALAGQRRVLFSPLDFANLWQMQKWQLHLSPTVFNPHLTQMPSR